MQTICVEAGKRVDITAITGSPAEIDFARRDGKRSPLPTDVTADFA
jgi:hypothetical protein